MRPAGPSLTTEENGARVASSALRFLPLVAAVLLALFLRFDRLGAPSYWLDEILGQVLTDRAVAAPPWHWLTGLEPEHGPLYYAVQLLSRLAGTGEAAGRGAAALLGVLTVPLLWLSTRAASGSERAANAGAFLIALSPLHVYYSREARPYALLMLFAAVALLALLRGSQRGALVACAALLYTSAVGAPFIAAVAAVGLLWFFVIRGSGEERTWSVAAGALLLMACVPLLYRDGPTTVTGTGFEPIDGVFFDQLLRAFSVAVLPTADGAGGRTALSFLIFALAGAMALLRIHRRNAVVVIGLTVLPIVFALASLHLFGHWYAVRYVTPALIGFLVLVAAGLNAMVEAVASLFRLRSSWRAAFAAVLLVAVLAVVAREVWPNARQESFRKLDWRAVAAAIWSHAKPSDYVLAAEPWSEISLGYYLDQLPQRVRLRHMAGVGIAQIIVDNAKPAWLVTAGFAPDASVRRWMCGYPLLLASPIEGFRLHYSPSRAHFLAERSGAAEQRALVAALAGEPLTVGMGANYDLFFAEGWGGAEDGGEGWLRWVIGERAAVVLPRGARSGAVIRLRALPIDHASLPPQTIRLSLNGTDLGTQTMPFVWREYSFAAAASLWNGGVNRLELEFGRAVAPAQLVPGSTDVRRLAAMFEWISVDDAGRPLQERPEPTAPPYRVRLAADQLLGDGGPRLAEETRFPPSTLRRPEVVRLLGRLGLDPEAIWPRLASGALPLDRAVETIATESACEDDLAFVRRAFATLYGRSPGDHEEQGMLRDLRTGVSRERLLARLLKTPEFRALVVSGQ